MNSLVRFQIFKELTGFGRHLSTMISRTQTLAQLSLFPSKYAIPTNAPIFKTINFLTPPVFNTMQICGMKVKGKVRKRCKDCYMVYKDHRVYNYCKTKPRHNQTSKMDKEKEYFILTEMTHGRVRKY